MFIDYCYTWGVVRDLCFFYLKHDLQKHCLYWIERAILSPTFTYVMHLCIFASACAGINRRWNDINQALPLAIAVNLISNRRCAGQDFSRVAGKGTHGIVWDSTPIIGVRYPYDLPSAVHSEIHGWIITNYLHTLCIYRYIMYIVSLCFVSVHFAVE